VNFIVQKLYLLSMSLWIQRQHRLNPQLPFTVGAFFARCTIKDRICTGPKFIAVYLGPSLNAFSIRRSKRFCVCMARSIQPIAFKRCSPDLIRKADKVSNYLRSTGWPTNVLKPLPNYQKIVFKILKTANEISFIRQIKVSVKH